MEDRIKVIEEKLDVEQKKILDEILRNQKAIQNDLNELKKETKLANNKNQIILKEFTSMKSDLKSVQAENRVLKDEIKSLRSSLEELMSGKTANQIEVVGLEHHGKSVNNIMLEIGKKIQMKITDSDFNGITSKKVGVNKKSEIFTVQFKHQQLRDEFLEKVKKKKLKNSDLSTNGSNLAIYFNETLSYYMRKVFNEARKLKKDKGYKFVWTKKGKVFVRKAEKENAIQVVNMEDIVILRQ